MKAVLESRAQKRFHKQLTSAAERRERLLDQGRVSLESGLGQLVIIVSGAPNYKIASRYSPKQQRQYFLEEAERLAEARAQEHQHVRIRTRAITGDIKFDLSNPHVTDIIMIGHGSIDTLWLDDQKRYFDWRQAARAATSLKQGKIEQRMCGNFPLERNVALGTFAVSDLTNVIAAPGVIVPDIDPDDGLFRPIYDSDPMDPAGVVDQIYALNQAYAGRAPEVPAAAA